MGGSLWYSAVTSMTSTAHRKAFSALATVCLYIAMYVALDRISMVHMLPDVGFTLWNPPPACSLVLLLVKGWRFAPALFPAAVLADVLNGGFSAGLKPMLAVDATIAASYAMIAVALRPFARLGRGFQSARDVAGFLVVASGGVLIMASLVGVELVLLQVMSAGRAVATVRHMWVGDITGVVGLFPALITIPSAWERWKEVPATSRAAEITVFVLLLALALWVVFGIAAPKDFQFFYLLFLPAIWVGVRHGLPWCTVAILVQQVLLIAVVLWRDYPPSDFADFQLLSLAIATTGLLLGTVVTERQRTELSLRHQQAELSRVARLTTAGALGSAIAHEISQPLATVATYVHACRTLQMSTPQKPDLLRELLAKAEFEALRAGEIVERLRDFLSKDDTRFAPTDPAGALHAVVDALEDEARSHGVAISIDAQTVAPVAADRLQIEQVLLNLIRNGIESVADHGVREKHVFVRLRERGDNIQVDVEDNGPGVSCDIAEHLFEPFATGKPKGMGVGLLLSREIVRFHGGDLWWDSAFVIGARFTFRLPIQGPRDNGM